MLLAFLIFAFGVAQVLLAQGFISKHARLYFAIATIILGGIPLVVQFALVMGELAHLPRKYWIKLQVHRLLMGISGYHGPMTNLVSDMPFSQLQGFLMRNFTVCSIQARPERAGSSTDELLSSLLLHFWWCVIALSGISLVLLNLCSITFLLILEAFVKLLGKVSFGDAFSGTYQTRSASLAVWVADEQNFHDSGDLFHDFQGRKVISKWEYPFDLEMAVPMILRDLDLKRMDLLKRVELSLRQGVSCEHAGASEQGNRDTTLRKLLEREESLRWPWEAVGQLNWNLWTKIFDDEECFRWEVLDGEELVQELFKLERLKLELKRRLKQQQQDRQELQPDHKQQDQQDERPLGDEFRRLLRVRREEQLEQLKKLELDQKLEYKLKHQGKLRYNLIRAKLSAMAMSWWSRWLDDVDESGLSWKRQDLQQAEDELRYQQQMDEWRLSPSDVLELTPKRLGKLQNLQKLHELQMVQSLMHKEPSEFTLQNTNLTISKVIRTVRLQATIFPIYRSRQMAYHIVATASHESSTSKFYFEEFQGYCDAANAAEFWKLMEILDENTFVVKRQMNPLLLQVDRHFKRDPKDVILPCEELKAIVKAILDDGKKLDAVHLQMHTVEDPDYFITYEMRSNGAHRVSYVWHWLSCRKTQTTYDF